MRVARLGVHKSLYSLFQMQSLVVDERAGNARPSVASISRALPHGEIAGLVRHPRRKVAGEESFFICRQQCAPLSRSADGRRISEADVEATGPLGCNGL